VADKTGWPWWLADVEKGTKMSPDLRVSDAERKIESTLANVTQQTARDTVSAPKAHAGSRHTQKDPERIAMRALEGSSDANEMAAGAVETSSLSDAKLAQSALSAIERTALLPAGKIRLVVRNAWLILVGEVEKPIHKRTAEEAVRGLHGIRGVSNNILIESEAMAQRVAQKIDEVFVRNARLSAHRISITASDHKIILSGCVRSAVEREEAEMAAWTVPGVAHVVNRLRATA
jgi:osmotically-inducible protein OsmY